MFLLVLTKYFSDFCQTNYLNSNRPTFTKFTGLVYLWTQMKDPKSFFDPPRDVVVSTIFVDKIYLLPSPCSSRDVSIFLGEGLLRLMLNTLNSSKTEFLLIIFSKKHAKINNSSLNTTHSA